MTNNEEHSNLEKVYNNFLEEEENQKSIRKKNLENAPKSNGYLVEHKDTGDTITPILVTEIEEVSIDGVRQKRLVNFINDEEEEK
ncbi:hypothetical protein [Staphylococcus phage vB_SsapH-Golestan-100]|nr:hypothetical protein [Staphylococcus phage vB_SsapH-Golestan-100]